MTEAKRFRIDGAILWPGCQSQTVDVVFASVFDASESARREAERELLESHEAYGKLREANEKLATSEPVDAEGLAEAIELAINAHISEQLHCEVKTDAPGKTATIAAKVAIEFMGRGR